MEAYNNLILTDQHEYFLDGRRVDGLTASIKEAGLIRNSDLWYADRGSKIHLATQYYDEGTLDEDSVDPQIKGYLGSWKRFRKDQNYIPVEIEYKIFNQELRVASMIDRLPLLDIKSGSPEPWHCLQIGFQYKTIGQTLAGKIPMDVYLDPKGGPPKVKIYSHYELMEAFKVYTSMLYFIRWRREKYGSASNHKT